MLGLAVYSVYFSEAPERHGHSLAPLFALVCVERGSGSLRSPPMSTSHFQTIELSDSIQHKHFSQ